MSFGAQLDQVERAEARLNTAVSGAGVWDDQNRRAFDNRRMQPLLTSAKKLKGALQRAEEKAAQVTRLIG